MNKKELAEIKKHFSVDDGLFTVGGVLSAYVDAEKNIKGKSIRRFIEIPEDEAGLIFTTAKRVLSGSMGKNLVEYAFPRDEYADGGKQKLLYNLLRSGLKGGAGTDDTPLDTAPAATADTFLTEMTTVHLESTFAVLVMHCTYSVIDKSKDDRSLEMSDVDYNFLVCAITPVSISEKELIFDGDTIKINPASLLTLADKPTDGFLYPVFSDRSPDVNCVLAYSKNAAKPNLSLIEGLLGCTFIRAPKSEREIFNAVLKTAAGDELDYTKIIGIDEKLSEIVAASQNETELAAIDARRLELILREVGVSEGARAGVEEAFLKTADGNAFCAVNLLNSKVNVKAEGITVSITGDSTGKLRTRTEGGRKCLIIDLDEPTVLINGIETSV